MKKYQNEYYGCSDLCQKVQNLRRHIELIQHKNTELKKENEKLKQIIEKLKQG